MSTTQRIQVIDSHTAGEPTRVVIAGGPDLGGGPLSDRVERFRSVFDTLRSAIVNEPRGSDVLVGALLTPPLDPESAAGIIFFNNAGYLGMCGHGAIGVVATLAHLGKIGPGDHLLETPVGTVRATLDEDGSVAIRNVPAYRFAKDVKVTLETGDEIIGDIAWGGNWFFLIHDHQEIIELHNVERLTRFSLAVKRALQAAGITGPNGAEIDHIELFSPSQTTGVDSKNFVLCPGAAYDRSPCGTGTSAKLACLYEDGKLAPGALFHQAGILNTVFTGSVERSADGTLIPTIRGRAFVNAESTLILNPDDPFCSGIRSE